MSMWENLDLEEKKQNKKPFHFFVLFSNKNFFKCQIKRTYILVMLFTKSGLGGGGRCEHGRGESIKKVSPTSNSRIVSPNSLLAFSHTHTILKLHKHSLGVDTCFRKNNGEGRAGRQGIRGLWSQIVLIRGNGMGMGYCWRLGRTTSSPKKQTRRRFLSGYTMKWERQHG